MYFEETKEILLREAYDLKDGEKLNSDYYKKFFDLVQDVILSMLEQKETFFGQFMLRVKRDIRLDIKVPIATIPKRDGFNMYFNPFLFLNCTKKEMIALFIHEIYHIMNSHYEREAILKNRFSKEAIGVALDVSINQYIKDLPPYSRKIDNVNMEYKLDLQENKSVEEYTEQIYKSIRNRIKENNISEDKDLFEIDMTKAHEIWDEIDIKEEEIEALTKKTAISSYDNNAPNGLESIILSYNKNSEIPWQSVLKNMIPQVKSGYKKTITRRDRRQSERLDLRGRLPKKESEIIVAIDISASMSEDDLHNILIEVLAITRAAKNKITIIECDNEIRSVYRLRSENDIRKRTKNNGSTAFSPVFKYIAENNLKNSILVYFTDGVGEEELSIKPVNKKTLWVICGDEEFSLKKTYGEVKRITIAKKEKIEGNIGLQMVNSVIHEWAR